MMRMPMIVLMSMPMRRRIRIDVVRLKWKTHCSLSADLELQALGKRADIAENSIGVREGRASNADHLYA
jgi:hypothetical protein